VDKPSVKEEGLRGGSSGSLGGKSLAYTSNISSSGI